MSKEEMQKEVHKYVEGAMEIIEEEIRNKIDTSEITEIIYRSIPYEKIYFGREFKSYTGCSLPDYIKINHYMFLFIKWSKTKPKLIQRATFEGAKYFPFLFIRAFGKSIYEIEDIYQEIPPNVITREQFVHFKETLENAPYIEKYQLYDGKVHMKVNFYVIMLQLLMLEPYVIPEVLFENGNWSVLSRENKKMVIGLLCKAQNEIAGILVNNNSLDIDLDEMNYHMKKLELYNVESPTLIKKSYIFAPVLRDELRGYFDEVVVALIKSVRFNKNFVSMNPLYKKVLESFRTCDGTLTFPKVVANSGMTKEEVLDVLWDMAKVGILRLEPLEEKEVCVTQS